ncbi:MAG: SDR family NAD(P)-dependent oxidoreductase [Firmicutes bacterium]|nr:SDR family NAD(P)-dependent oxidoreductase [Bacillota bacterium]
MSIMKYIFSQVAANQLPLPEAKNMIKELQDLASNTEDKTAIIGMACRFPKASNPDEFWRNITGGANCIDDFPVDRAEICQELSEQSLIARILSGSPQNNGNGAVKYVKGGYIQDIDKFDAAFFRITPKEAMFMDPLQRVFLEVAYEAMEDAGYGGLALYGAKVGVFVGKDHTSSTMYKYVTEPDDMHLTGSWTGILASRISYLYNFRGPSMVIDTACSSGLVSLHEACRALNKNECEIAIAGGIHLQIFAGRKDAPRSMEMVESKDEQVRTFDKNASGTVWSEGAGALILKPLSKAIACGDHIYGVIVGSAINNDGASNGIIAPNAEAQKELLIQVWRETNIDPETISYIEAHGTGTNLGDPIEIKGITTAFEEFTAKKQFCGIGSVKTNVGHMVAASGIASVIKVVLALKNQVIPPSINFESPNPYINFLNSPVYVNDRLRPWNSTPGAPRRAGVSAFGFSGTNCHVILEEPPEIRGIHEPHLPGPHILTLSARNQEILRELLKRYQSFFEQNTGAALEDICYTANTGRGHYDYRIALMAASLEDVKRKVARLLTGALETVREPGIYFGAFKIVSNYGPGGGVNELTENDRRKLSAAANQKLKERLAAGAPIPPEFLADLCRSYIQGADIAWDELYRDQNLRRVSLPVYPLERIKYWAGPNTFEIQGVQIDSKPIHPLLHKLLASTPDQKIYSTEFSVEGQWVLNEHRVLNYYIVPGATYLEMARVASLAFYGNVPIQLYDFMFIEPLVVAPGTKKEVQTILKKGPAYLEVTVASKTANSLDDERWTVHAQGKITPAGTGEKRVFALAKLIAGLDPFRISLGGEVNRNFTFGPRWDNAVYAAGKNGQAIIELKLPEEFQDDLLEYKIHPALMDQAVDIFSQEIEGMRLPLMYKKIAIYGPMPPRFFCHLRQKQGTGGGEILELDATLMDESGQVFIEIEDYSLKKVRPGAFGEELELQKEAEETFDYGFIWRREELKAQTAPANGFVLIFKDETGVAERIIEGLRPKGRLLIEVETGPGYEQIAEHKFRIKGGEADYQKLAQALQGKKIAQILHFMSIEKETGPGESSAALEEKNSKGLFSLFYLCRAFAGYNFQDQIDLVLIADYVNEVTKAEDRINPAAAAFFGLGKCIHPENEKLRCRVIDIDHYTAAETILAEILAPGPVYQVAYRHNQRFVEEFQVVDPQIGADQAGRENIVICPGGVYVITGGAGGIGLEIGKYLAGKGPLKLALLNRTALPDRETWDAVLAQNTSQKLARQIRAIREMEQAGAEVLIYSTDICCEQSLKPVLDDIRHKFGKINGVIHAAGIAGAGFMINKDIGVFKNVIAPKIQGTWLLDRLTEADDLDFFIMFSSIITITGGAGQSDYTAANSYLDSFAVYRNKQGKKTVSVNWPLWENVGMAADYGVTGENLIFKAVSRTSALNTFGKVLARLSACMPPCNPRIIRGELNYPMISAVSEAPPFIIGERINIAIQKQKAKLARNQAVTKERPFQKAALIGIDRPDEGQTVYIMAQIWARVLGLTEIDIHQSFYDMGGNSLIALQIIDQAKKSGLDVSLQDILSYKTIDKICANLNSGIKANAPIGPGGGPESSGVPESSPTPGLSRKGIPAREGFRQYEIHLPEVKILPLKFQNEITSYLHYILQITVVLTDERLVPWYYEHFINIFTCMGPYNMLRFDFLEYEFIRNQFLTSIQFNYELLGDVPEIIPFLLDKINRGYYAIIYLDEYYLAEKHSYQKKHLMRTSLIYGYNHPERKFLAFGFNEQQVLGKITLAYDQFLEAYEEGKVRFPDLAPWAEKEALELLRFKNHATEYPFDLTRFLRRLDDYLEARGDNSVIYHYELPDENVAYGAAVYTEVVRHLQNIFTTNQLTLPYVGFHFLAEHKKGIYNRLRYAASRYGAAGDLLQMIAEYYPIVQQFEAVRVKCLEFNYEVGQSGFANLETVVKEIIEAIESIQAKEGPLLSEISRRLKLIS